MIRATAEKRTVHQIDNPPVCAWKIVLEHNLEGEGTSFDPANLTLSAFRCLKCDGFERECHRYTY